MSVPGYLPSCKTRMFTYKNRYLRQLNIDKDLLTMRNFDVYDPMKRGTSVVLDGQTLAHVEVCSSRIPQSSLP